MNLIHFSQIIQVGNQQIFCVTSLCFFAYLYNAAAPLPPSFPWKTDSVQSILLGCISIGLCLPIATGVGTPFCVTLCLESPILNTLLAG